MRSHACSGVEIPPTLTSTSLSPTRSLRRLSTSSERFSNGAPLIPPAPIFSTLEAGVFSPSREMVVLVATMPARSSSTARSATASMSSSERSGAIFTSTGVVVDFFTTSRIGRSSSTACRSRRPGVLGEETLTTR